MKDIPAAPGLTSPSRPRQHVADYTNNAIRVVDLDAMTVSTLAGGGPGAAGFVDGSGADARFSQVQNIAFDGDSTLYVADYTNGIRTVNVNTGETGTIYRNDAQYVGSGIALDGAGHVFFSDNYRTVRQLDLATGADSPGRTARRPADDAQRPSAGGRRGKRRSRNHRRGRGALAALTPTAPPSLRPAVPRERTPMTSQPDGPSRRGRRSGASATRWSNG
jgi:hypothetical protein